MKFKSSSNLSVSDLIDHPIWEYKNTESDGEDETAIVPVEEIPVDDLSNRLIGLKVTLSSGAQNWAILGNLSLKDSMNNRHFLTVSLERDGKWFDLARYHDADFSLRGPAQAAMFLNLPVSSIFPIAYDIRKICRGIPALLTGSIPSEVSEKLSSKELMDLVFKNM